MIGFLQNDTLTINGTASELISKMGTPSDKYNSIFNKLLKLPENTLVITQLLIKKNILQ